jgi:ribosomal protein S24E
MMSLKVTEKKKNPLMKREEVHATIEHSGKPTPPRKEILPHLEKFLKAKGDLILIDKIFSVKGKGESKLKVFVYSKKDDIPKDKLELIQRRSERKKAKGEKEKPAEGEAKPSEGETPAEGEEKKPEEEAKEEKPSEEKKEEKPEEKKEEGKEKK